MRRPPLPLLVTLAVLLPASGLMAAMLPLSFQVSKTQRSSSQPCAIKQRVGSARGDGLRIARVRWVQVVAQDPDSPDTVLAGGKDTLVRVDVIATRAGQKAPATRTLWLADAGGKRCTALPLKGPATLPTQPDVGSLNSTFTAVIPAVRLQPGLRMIIQLDDGARSLSELNALVRGDAPSVMPSLNEELRLIPLQISGQTGKSPPPGQRAGTAHTAVSAGQHQCHARAHPDRQRAERPQG